MKEILDSYLKRLTNLSGNNRSLLLLRLISDQVLDLHDLDFTLEDSSFNIISGLISSRKKIPVSSVIDSRDKSANSISRKLKKLDRIEKFIFEERGSKDLYVGWPFVRGRFLDGTLVRCPLIFFPVSLQNENGVWSLVKREDVNTTFNKSFLLAFSYFNQIPVNEELLDTNIDDLDSDSTVFRTQLYELLKESNLEINFNQENFLDQLKPFKNFRRNELESATDDGKLKLFPEAALGIFPQSGSYLVPDYVQLTEEKNQKTLEEFFFDRTKAFSDNGENVKYSDKVLEENTYTPFELDAYQEDAIKKIKSGNSIIVEGPPGTGKSQLISNLIADFTARGKNVLLVCQKRAALDVVYERLKEKEIHDFIGLVHDFKNDRKSIFENIAKQIDRLQEYKQKNVSLDAIQLERNFQQASRKIEILTENLEEFRQALFDENECGKSIKALYLESDSDQPFVNLRQDYSSITYKDVDEFSKKLTRYFTYFNKFENSNHFWSNELDFSKFESSDFIRIKDAIHDAIKTFDEFLEDSRELLHKELDYETVSFYLLKSDEINQLISNLDNDETYVIFQKMLEKTPDEDGQWLVDMEKTVMKCFNGDGMESSLKSSELGRFQEALEHAIKARRNIFSWLSWKLFSKDQIFVTRVLVANELKSNKEGFQTLLNKIDNRLNYEHNLSIILKKDWLFHFPESMRKIEVQNWFFYSRIAYKSYKLVDELRNIDSYVNFKVEDRNQQINLLTQFLALLEKIPVHKMQWSNYLSDNQLRLLLTGKVELDQILKELESDFDSLRDYHQLRESFSVSENKILELISEKETNTEEAVKIFHNSLALSWIDHIEAKYPVLRSVSTLEFEQNLKDLRESVDIKRKTSSDILLLKLREKTYEDVEYNRLQNRVTYRDLHHQVTKKKRIWPLRKVIQEFDEELFRLIPCWMASPESASAIFPMKQFFDLVIFDEASQCFAERGIPAMFRGKQIVVAGDEKQLRPFDLYRVRWEEENTEDIPELEVDSLLELTRKYLPSVRLNGHYRSKSLELIEFSNRHFYDGKLRMLPLRENMNKDIPAISYVKAEGVWEDGKNEKEAEIVISLIEKINNNHPDKSIGIVTFNSKQQNLILDFIDQKIQEWGVLPENLFVKNIENVQGDERDIIIFSTAYAPDEKGKLRLQFGSLNVQGGENRLNVAITRARNSIYIVSSLTPAELHTEETKNEGPKLLKSYLEYAWNVSAGKWKPSIIENHKNRPDWYLSNRVEEKYKNLNPNVQIGRVLPFGDLTLYHKNKYYGLIMTDDEYFFNATNAKDIFVYTPEIFIDKKWPFAQLFSRELWRSRTETEDKLRLFLNRISSD